MKYKNNVLKHRLIKASSLEAVFPKSPAMLSLVSWRAINV